MKLLILYFLSLNVSAAPKVLMLNFNNQDKEVAACAAADPDNVYTVDDSTKGAQPWVDATTVGEMLQRMDGLAQRENWEQSRELGDCANQVDTITISGHHGVEGKWFGGKKDVNGISVKQLREQLAKVPNLCNCVKNVVLMGCYTGTVDAGEQHYLKICPNVNFTMGFPLQAPVGTNPASAKTLKQMCSPKTRAAAARVANTKDALCKFRENLPALGSNVSLSNCYSISSSMYGSQACYTFDELKQRCAKFDPTGQMRATYDAYLNADPGFEMPPKDGADVDAEPGSGPIREYYNQLHLWYHCRQEVDPRTGTTHDMPSTGQVIRLAKFTQIRNNINRLNRAEIADYDEQLRNAGLGKFGLGDMEANNTSRRTIRGRILAVERELRQRFMDGVATKRDRALWHMNQGLNSTFVELASSRIIAGEEVNCSLFSLVHDGETSADAKSGCVMSYRKALSIPVTGGGG